MTSVNSPACLLARNHFYRDSPPSPEWRTPVFGRQNNTVILCVTMTAPPGGSGAKGLWVHVDLGCFHFSTSKPTRPADRGIK